MGKHILPAGTELDGGRYRIEGCIGQGGFGITYTAQKVCLEQKVAVKELYWRGHSRRDVDQTRDVRITIEKEAEEFSRHKERFGREARILRDFADLPGVVRIDDYFEENDTAYIVMEYVRGETLAQYLKSAGTMPAQEMFERFLPLVEGLGKIHENGVIHRDISPDNIMVMPDGSLKLIDFGAARDVGAQGEGHSVVVKAGYAPFEQYSLKGVQGAWTDVYALCATMYHCLTGAAPVDSITRAYAETKLPRPSEKGANIKPKYEEIIMRGLEMDHKKRYEHTGRLAKAMQAALPRKRRYQELLLGFGAGLLCLALAIGGLVYREYDRANRFRGVVTETFYLTAPSELTAAEFAAAQETLRERLDAFAGEDNYLMDVEGARLRVELPLDLFDGREIGGVIAERFASLAEGAAFGVNFQSHVNWEDPHTSLTPGENQAAASELTGSTGVFVYTWSGSDALTPGERAHLIIDFKVRLDALGAPYAFGTLYGDENLLAFRMDPQHLNAFVLGSIGGYSLHITAGDGGPGIYLNHSFGSGVSLIEEDGKAVGVAYAPQEAYRKEEMLETAARVLHSEDPMLYLEDGNGNAVAVVPAEWVSADGAAEFRIFRMTGGEAERASIARYVAAVLNQTSMPVPCYYAASEMLDEQGNSLFRPVKDEDLGTEVAKKPSEEALIEEVRTLCAQTGYKAYREEGGAIWIHMGLDADAHLPQDLAQALETALKTYAFDEMIYDASMVFVAVDEQENERCRIIVSGSWDAERGEYVREIQLFVNEGGRLAPLAQAVNDWWATFEPEQYGFDKWEW